MPIYDRERRSKAAKKGWLTRRNKAVESGKLSLEQFFEIYNAPYGTISTENLFEYSVDNVKIDLTTGEVISIDENYDSDYVDEQYIKNNIAEQEYEELLQMGEIIAERMPSSLNSSQFSTELNNTVIDVLNDIEREIGTKNYYRFLVDVVGDIDTYISQYGDESNVYVVYSQGTSNLVSKIISLAQQYDYNPSYDDWRNDLKSAMERDSRNYQKLHYKGKKRKR